MLCRHTSVIRTIILGCQKNFSMYRIALRLTLEYAFALKRQIDTIVEYLKKQALPEKISVENMTKVVENPFE